MLDRPLDNNWSHQQTKMFMNDKVKQACEALGLDHFPAPDELKRAYKQMVKQWHPDRFHNDREMEPVAVERTQKINRAYRILLAELDRQDGTARRNGNGFQTRNTRHVYTWQTYSDGFPNPDVTEFFLNSSHIVSAGYDKTRRILYLKFLGDEIYLYYDVPGFIFEHLLIARSPGKYALKFIYNRFRHRKFTPLVRK